MVPISDLTIIVDAISSFAGINFKEVVNSLADSMARMIQTLITVVITQPSDIG
jgi:hypothetical protein